MDPVLFGMFLLTAFAVLFLFGCVLVATESSTVEKLVKERLRDLPSSRKFVEEKKALWGKLSISGEDPIMVIALIRYITAENTPAFERTVSFITSYYSQIKFLIWKKPVVEGSESMTPFQKKVAILFAYITQLVRVSPIRAIVFWLEAHEYSKAAMLLWDDVPDDKKSQEHLEVIGAPCFMAARKLRWIPFVARHFKEKALSEFLLRADSETNIVQSVAPHNALLYAKIYALNNDEEFKNEIKNMGLTRAMDADVLRRITQHLGMKSVDELFCFINE